MASVAAVDAEVGSEEDANSAEDEDAEMLHSSKLLRIRRETQWVITSFTVMMFVHACICEGPAAIVECALRAPLCMGYGVACCALGVALCSSRLLAEGLRSVKESLVVLAAMLTLLVPGCCLLPYRSFQPEDDWNVEPIPTLAGWVDVRRFVVYAFGQADMAANIHERHYSQDTCDERMWCFPRQWLTQRRHMPVPTSSNEEAGDDESNGIELAEVHAVDTV